MKVRVYWNFTRKTFSVMSEETKRVIGHSDAIIIDNVTFKVNQGGRQRVLREKSKNVHAFVCGEISKEFINENISESLIDSLFNPETKMRCSYNPYKYDSFVTEFGDKITKSNRVILSQGKIYAVKNV